MSSGNRDIPKFLTRGTGEDLDKGTDGVECSVQPDYDLNTPVHQISRTCWNKDLHVLKQDGQLYEEHRASVHDRCDIIIL